MVTRIRWLCLTVLVLVGLGCRTFPAPVGPAVSVGTPDEVRREARRRSDPAAAAEIAWAAGNDRSYAQERLDEAIARRPRDAGLRLRRGLLALQSLDMPEARAHLVRAIAAGPSRAESAAALITLHGWRSELAAQSSTLAKELGAIGLADSRRAVAPFHRALATAFMIELADAPKPERLRRMGGWLPRARVVGPLGPEHDRVLQIDVPLEDAVNWQNRAPFRGVVPPIRTVEARGVELPFAAGNRRGQYLVQAFFRLPENKSGLLQVRVPSFGRIKIDGFTVLQRDPAAERPPGLLARRIRLDRGWHRLTVLVTGGSADRIGLSLLDGEGRPMAAEFLTEPPSAPLAIAGPDLGPTSIAAYGKGHPYWLAAPRRGEPERALFGRLVAASSAMSRWLDDLESARGYMYGLTRAAPDSAAVQSTMARLASWSRLPDNLVQAHLREAVARDPTNPSLLIGLARRTMQQDPSGALELTERAKALAPRAFAPYALAFRLHRAKQWHAEASENLKRAAALGAPPRILQAGARHLRYTGEVRAADALEALAIERSVRERSRLEAARAVRRGDLDKAIAILSAGPQTGSDRVRIAQWQLATGDLEAATATCRAALAEDPLHGPAIRTLALAEAARGRFDAARAAMTRLRAQGQTTPSQEALAASWGDLPLSGPPRDSWLGRSLAFDPLRHLAPLPGSSRPRGLDAADRWAGQGEVQVLDRMVDRVLLDGSAISMHHQVVRLQTKEATRRGRRNQPSSRRTAASTAHPQAGRLDRRSRPPRRKGRPILFGVGPRRRGGAQMDQRRQPRHPVGRLPSTLLSQVDIPPRFGPNWRWSSPRV